MYPDYCSGLVISGCCLDYSSCTSSIYFGYIGFMMKMHGKKHLWRIIPDIFDLTPRERIDKAILRDGIDYSKWNDFATMAKKSKKGYYEKCLSRIPHNVLFINAEHDYRSAEKKMMEAVNKNTKRGELIILEDTDRMYFIEEEHVLTMSREIFRFINNNKR